MILYIKDKSFFHHLLDKHLVNATVGHFYNVQAGFSHVDFLTAYSINLSGAIVS